MFFIKYNNNKRYPYDQNLKYSKSGSKILQHTTKSKIYSELAKLEILKNKYIFLKSELYLLERYRQ